jgi:pimeloyl-ACP methyl ester carboxylesterase
MNSRSKSIQMMIKIILLLCIVAFTGTVAAYAYDCPDPWPSGCECGSLGDQLILTCLPDNFNGTLIVYAHGYVYPQEDLALPIEEIGADNLGVISLLVVSGFGFATTSYSVNGYAVEQSEGDLIALVNHFEGLLEQPGFLEKVLLVGASEGGLITTMMLERHSDLFDGGLAMCGPIGGMPYQLNYIGDFKVIFDYFFPRVFDFGMADVPEEACDAWESDYVPAIWRKIQSHPWKTLRLFNITDAAFNLLDATSFAETAETVLKYSTCGTNDLIGKAGGMPYDNQSTWYDGSLWLNLFVERVAGDPVAQQYVKDYYQTTGNLNVPLVTLHNLSDPAVPYRHEEIYKQLVAQKGKSGNLTVWPVLGYGHCNFKPWQVLGAFYILHNQVNN